MKFSRDSALWTLGIVAALVAYLVTDGRNPLTWDYISWVKFIEAALAVLMAKLATSPLESKTALRMAHPGKTILALCLMVGLTGAMGCAVKNGVQTMQTSHDSLALAQDLEARLCWNVASVFDGPTDKSHCTAPIAATIGLTDARHQAINQKLSQAFTVHRSVTAQLATGATNVDLSFLSSLITAILGDLAELKQTPDVTQLVNAVSAGKVVK